MDFYSFDLAYVHDQGFSSLAKDSANWLIRQLRKHGIGDGVVLELGCGSGHTLKALVDAGYRPIGLDISRSMLEIASRVAPAAVLKKCSILQCKIPSCSAVLSIGEAINYIPNSAKSDTTASLFRRVYSGLDDNGIFIFDAIVDLPETRTRYRDWYAGPDWSVQVEVLPTRVGLTRGITIFRKVGRNYRKTHEVHSVRIFSETRLKQRLENSGFHVSVQESYGKVRLGPGRRVFICTKKSA